MEGGGDPFTYLKDKLLKASLRVLSVMGTFEM